MKKYNQFGMGFIFAIMCFIFMGQTKDISSRYTFPDESGRYQGFGTDYANRFLIDTKTGQMFWYDHRTNKGWIHEKNSDVLFFEEE